MLPLIVLVAAVAVTWRFGFWPFSRSFKYLPSYGQVCQKRAGASPQAPVVTPTRPAS
jgi:hypothetical protein